ncbi:hypothetical protein BIW11_02211 [Tropilaelaps mercedesae]|uniref:Ig-like domain-containing protein n=1 Tax=Tropilaelaps mercedesae TaxID=418985 RepID=A0A1V9X196_9ACAR|nr:hypothetical protein BIW11_02211 [Tropilaelaps mercedesae]
MNSNLAHASRANGHARIRRFVLDDLEYTNRLYPLCVLASMVVTAVMGDKVALPCSVEPAEHAGDDAAVLVLWYKDDIPQPVFTVDGRAAPRTTSGGLAPSVLRSAPQTTSLEQLNGRASFEIDHRPAFLQLQPVADDDAGQYRCRVDFRRARSMNTVIDLRIIVPPGEPVVSTEEGGEPIRSEGLAGPFNEGEPLTLVCTAAMGKPRASLVWIHNGRIIDESFSYDLLNSMVKNSLEIDVLRRDHLLTAYTCQTTNSNMTAPAQTTVTLDVNVRPLDVRIEPDVRALSAGSSVQFLCSSSGSRPPAHLSWWLGDRQLPARTDADFIANDDSGTLGASSTTSVLVLTPSAADHGATLACRAQNANMPDKAIQSAHTLDVHYAPQITLALGANLRPIEIFENRDVYLDCNIRANPPASEVVWHLEEKELHTDKHNGIIVSSSSLVLQKVSRTQRGWYTCSASNREGSTVSNRLFLRVKYAPRCRPGQRRVYGVDLFESAQIACELDADPQEKIDFTWSFNTTEHFERHSDSSKNHLYNRHHFQQKEQSDVKFTLQPIEVHRSSRDIINYRPVSEQDYGELLCFGRNEVGAQQHFTYVAELYNDDHDAEVSAPASGGATAAKSSPPPLCIANVSVTGGHPATAPLLFIFSDVPHSGDDGAGYRVHIYAVNRKGRSASARVIAHVLNASRYTQASGGAVRLAVLRPLLGLLVGLIVTATLVGILAFTAAVCHKRCQEDRHNAGASQKDMDKWGVTLLKAEAPGQVMAEADCDLDCDCASPVCHPLGRLGLDAGGRGPSLLDLGLDRQGQHHHHHHHPSCVPGVMQQQHHPESAPSGPYRGGRYIGHQSHPDDLLHACRDFGIDPPANDDNRDSAEQVQKQDLLGEKMGSCGDAIDESRKAEFGFV